MVEKQEILQRPREFHAAGGEGAQTEKVRDTCLRAAAAYDVLAGKAEKGEAGEDDEQQP